MMVDENQYVCDACGVAQVSIEDLIEDSRDTSNGIWDRWRHIIVATVFPNSSKTFLVCPACLDTFRRKVIGDA